jgi:hypothetical protein
MYLKISGCSSFGDHFLCRRCILFSMGNVTPYPSFLNFLAHKDERFALSPTCRHVELDARFSAAVAVASDAPSSPAHLYFELSTL